MSRGTAGFRSTPVRRCKRRLGRRRPSTSLQHRHFKFCATRLLSRAALLVSLVGALSAVGVSGAYASCSGTAGNYFDGAYTGSSYSNLGAQARIYLPAKPPTCGSRDFSDPWVMITDGGTDYAQIGVGMDYLSTTGHASASSPRYIGFLQYTRPGNSPYTKVFAPPAIKSDVTFADRFESDTKLHMKMGGTQFGTTSYEPTASWKSLNWQGQFFNEVAYRGSSHMWGVATNKLAIHPLKVQRGWPDWTTPSSVTSYNNNTNRWGVSQYTPSVGNKGVHVWEK